MATLLIQQPDGLFCTFDPDTASFRATSLTRDKVIDAVREAAGHGYTPEGLAARTGHVLESAETDRARWAKARERVIQVHGPDAAEWMRHLDRQAAISTLPPEGQAWARAFEAEGTPR